MDASTRLAHGQDVATKVSLLFQKRLKIAQEHYRTRVQAAYEKNGVQLPTTAAQLPMPQLAATPAALQGMMTNWFGYAVDFAQRSILFWDTLRQRGNNYLEHTKQGMPPVLTFAYETIVDARKFARPV